MGEYEEILPTGNSQTLYAATSLLAQQTDTDPKSATLMTGSDGTNAGCTAVVTAIIG